MAKIRLVEGGIIFLFTWDHFKSQMLWASSCYPRVNEREFEGSREEKKKHKNCITLKKLATCYYPFSMAQWRQNMERNIKFENMIIRLQATNRIENFITKTYSTICAEGIRDWTLRKKTLRLALEGTLREIGGIMITKPLSQNWF
jgi:hypothetical protein